MKRRTFIKDSAMLVAAAGAGNVLKGAERSFDKLRMTDPSVPSTGSGTSDTLGTDNVEGKLITSAPMLQNYSENSIGVAFAVGALANGYGQADAAVSGRRGQAEASDPRNVRTDERHRGARHGRRTGRRRGERRKSLFRGNAHLYPRQQDGGIH